MKLAAHLLALLALFAASPSLPAQDAAPIVRNAPKTAAAATGSTGAAKPRPRPLTIEEIEKIQAAKAAARAAAGTTGAKASTGTMKPATAATGATHPLVIVAKPVAKSAPKPTLAPSAPITPAMPATGILNRTTIVLDPAHGGSDSGSRLADNLVEKDVTLAFAFKLRSLLQARGFNVVLTRDSDSTPDSSPAPLTLDDRAGIANHSRAVACLLLHATASGNGVHLYHSELDPVPTEAATLPWLTAQAAWVAQSTTLAGKFSQAFTRAGIPFISSAASVRPVDSLTCPALVVELAPKGSDASTLNDSSYQQSVAEALASALVFWKNQAQPPQKADSAATPTTEAP